MTNETSCRQAADGRRIASLLLGALLPQGSSLHLALHPPSAAWRSPVSFGALHQERSATSLVYRLTAFPLTTFPRWRAKVRLLNT